MNHAESTFANSQRYMKEVNSSCFHGLFQIAVNPLEMNSKVNINAVRKMCGYFALNATF